MLTRTFTLTALLIAGVGSQALLAEEPSINEKIVRYCQERVGQQVGDGECFALANDALHAAGGTRRFADSPNKGDYVWGELVYVREAGKSSGKPEDILPGHIIQFRDVVFRNRRNSFHFEHHTAVVEKVGNNGMELKILQENFSGKKVVTALTLNLNDFKEGWIRVYQPLAARDKNG